MKTKKQIINYVNQRMIDTHNACIKDLEKWSTITESDYRQGYIEAMMDVMKFIYEEDTEDL